MNRSGVFSCALGFAAVSLAAPALEAAPSQTDCAQLVTDFKPATKAKNIRKRLRSGKPSVLAASWLPAAGGVPESCQVNGFVDTGDKAVGLEHVNFQIDLPTPWC